MWVVRAVIEPMVWAFTCDKSKTGNCLPSGFTHDEKDAKTYKTYKRAVQAEMKLRKEKGYTYNQTETSGTQEPTTMTARTTEVNRLTIRNDFTGRQTTVDIDRPMTPRRVLEIRRRLCSDNCTSGDTLGARGPQAAGYRDFLDRADRAILTGEES
jgi:hypothetical protein